MVGGTRFGWRATLISLLAPPRAKISFRTAIEREGKGSLQGTSSNLKKKVPLGGRILKNCQAWGSAATTSRSLKAVGRLLRGWHDDAGKCHVIQFCALPARALHCIHLLLHRDINFRL